MLAFEEQDNYYLDNGYPHPNFRHKLTNQQLGDFCLALLQDPKCFVPVQIFWARPKIELNFSAPPKSFVLAQKLNLLYENHLLVWDWHNM